MKRTTVSRIVFSAALSTLSLVSQANPTVESNGVLANKDGKTLYVFTKDAANKSHCNGGCATAWPPFAVANPALAGGDFSIVTRDDGAKQWAFKGRPLYFFAGDTKPGDMNGEGSGGVWFVVKSQATPVKSSSRGGYYDSASTNGTYAY
jgi:predicted lipoprotein with Yx(FWY)xxD motif